MSTATKGSLLNPTKSVTRRHRSAFVLLLDLSGSMRESVEYESDIVTKSVAMSDVSNKILQEFYMRSFRDNDVCDYFDIAIIGYSNGSVLSLLNDNLDDPLVSIKELNDRCKDQGKQWIKIGSTTPFTSREILERSGEPSIIISPEGSTPMYEAMTVVHRALYMWCSRHENYDSLPPMVFHVTDGHPTDNSIKAIVDISNKIKSLRTNCGEVLFMGVKFESLGIPDNLLFPTDEEIDSYPCDFVRAMARSVSIMPEDFTHLIDKIRERRYDCGYRGFGCNISIADIISMIDIGTLSAVGRG